MSVGEHWVLGEWYPQGLIVHQQMVKYTYVLFNLSLFIKHNSTPKVLNPNYNTNIMQ
jgi:hypothetical protein